MTLPPGLLNLALRLIEKPHMARAHDHIAMRRRFRLQARLLFPDPPFAAYLPDRIGGIPGQWARARPAPGRARRPGVILYLHGGAYAFGAPETHRAMLARLAAASGLDAFLPDYRLAPEHPFPAGHEDALAAYEGLLARGYRASQIALGGDSAGGGLMLGLLHAICSRDLPRPGAAFALSPWCDLTLSGASIRENARADPFLPANRLPELSAIYLAGADPRDPRASPLFGTFAHAPPVLILVGDSEILLDDARAMTRVLKAQGVAARLDVRPGMPHVWPIFQGWLKQADAALCDIAAFLDRAL